MPLEAYPRGRVWWARGTVDYNGLPITGYIRESTRAASEGGAKEWIRDREDRERRRYLLGEEERPLTFNDAVLLYLPQASAETAKHLVPIVAELGEIECRKITPAMIRALGKQLYPKNATDSWRRWVITPARAVINHAADLGKCPPIRVKGFNEDERVAQDKARKKASRLEQIPGSWDWLLAFREHAPRRHAALALFMFATGARIGQAIAMHPGQHLDLQNRRVTIPGAKGHGDRTVEIPMELVVELANLRPKTPRCWDRTDKRNLRVFGFASRCGPLKAWKKACKAASIPYIPPHAAGRHGFGQEMRVRQGVDKKAVERFGGWSPKGDMLDKIYTHAEASDDKILAGFRAGLEQAEGRTGLRLLR